ncbi:sugar diacid recognition domain-containing protein [Sporosarcina aquimarina]|uniref:Sugar diacid recognition domain-containing protein n=1 Tax=Sporosarcina aquimarina TaxID=114975 RepID=A0ABU4G039_9BACL|nr:sugar diacid recognition domain-containing protein [Sporosarcina aquimarina]MDW0109735.1 sugar diacid recognition domain-containing protein [Sporosarcina aquimarina]
MKTIQRKGLKGLQDIGHYAQSIVEQFSTLLNIPISITDKNGMVIGSTDNTRLGSLHTVTAEVTKSGKVMYYSQDKIAGLDNVLPGIAVPLRFQQETVGVLGLIGDPEIVERYVSFVQSHIEMILMENFRSKSVASQMELKRSFFQRISSYIKADDLEGVGSYFEMHGFVVGIPRHCILLDLQVINNNAAVIRPTHEFSRMEQELYLFLTNLFNSTEQDLIVPLSAGQWLILSSVQSDNNPAFTKRIEFVTEKLCNFLDTLNVDSKPQFSCSPPVSSIEEILQVYEQCRKALETAKRNGLVQSFVSIEDWNVLSLGLVEEVSLPGQWTLDRYVEKLQDHVNSSVLIESFLVYCEEQLNMSQAARKLYIHRNTLLYRMQQLQQLLNFDLQCFRQCTLLYLALKQHQTIQNTNGKENRSVF